MPRNRRTAVEEDPEVEEDEVDTNDVVEEEEMDFSITCRPATRLDELFPIDDEDEQEGGDAEVIPDVGSSSTKSVKRKGRSKKTFPTLPNPPPFDNIFLHAKPAHTGYPKLPLALLLDKALPPFDIFSLFFSTSVLESIASNTNAYAKLNNARVKEGSRKWKETTAEELRIFLGIIVYLGVFVPKGPAGDLWSTSSHFPQHDIAKFMTVHRFHQLKQFLHISSPHKCDEHWYSNLEPLSSKLSKDFSTFYIPSTDVSVDEMIVRFSGRSSHTVKMKCKPTPEGYKIYALCEAG
ncbi:hypothetical protein K457DRAFT_143467 [Linnemannia elongata AG-77]|uniref:PiggyBac transposable element-derived protein domain-containing protein n=1 Tax=Linnemannia elongata AG-77 TaxID=1314771 RepID=A0A197JBI2_9FUNG|nr:hypothetical protein K457DRAFT_143467 [Linnemannia elongata AG-77]